MDGQLPRRPGPPPAFVTAELAGWQEMAQTWPLTFNLGDPYLRCAACDQAVIRLQDDAGRGYAYAPEQTSACMVAHIRQAHARQHLPAVPFVSDPPGTDAPVLGDPTVCARGPFPSDPPPGVALIDLQVALHVFMSVLILGTVWRLLSFHLAASPNPGIQHVGRAMNIQY